MTLIELMEKYGTQADCVKLLEQIRWGDSPACVYCGSDQVRRQIERKQQSRWKCRKCKKSYSVTVGTIFHGTHLELPYWFAILTLMLNAKKSLSSYQISRDIGIRQPTVHSVQNRIRHAMSTDQGKLLKGIVEMDETYIGGKPRKANQRKNRIPAKRGHGTKKLPVIGIVERGGSVVAKVLNGVKVGADTLKRFVRQNVDLKNSHLMTDEYKGYDSMSLVLPHSTINHSVAYSFKGVHTNTIDGFWGLLKRAWYGQHHHYTRIRSHLYVAETAYKYNTRKDGCMFMNMIKKMLRKIF